MDKMGRSEPVGPPASTGGTSSSRRTLRRARAHPLVASLAGGLRATYAAEPEDAMPDVFASLIARLDRGGSHAG